MYYMCPECENIYEHPYQARDCCPVSPARIDDELVVVCWRCKGDGCDACYERGIMLVREVRARDELAMATIRKYL